MEKNSKEMHVLSDTAILKILGDFLQHSRLNQNKTQQQIAVAAGVNRSTIVQFEKGNGGTLLSFVQILRALEQLNLFQSFEIKQQISPLLLAKLEQTKRKRASNKKLTPKDKPKSDW